MYFETQRVIGQQGRNIIATDDGGGRGGEGERPGRLHGALLYRCTLEVDWSFPAFGNTVQLWCFIRSYQAFPCPVHIRR